MSPLRAFRAGLRTLFRRDAVDQELGDELAHYLEQATQDNMRAGMSRAAAERAARIQMGGTTATTEHVHDGGWEAHVESVLQDVRYGLRALRRSPGFAATAVLTLALGIGANTAMFSVVNAVMFRPLPWRDADKLALIWTNDTRRGLPREATAFSTVTDWRAENRTFADIAYFSTQRVALTARDPAVGNGRSRIAYASPNLFSVLGVAPARGRALSADDDATRAQVAVISHSLWQRWFASDSAILGMTVAIDGDSKMGGGALTIVGVMPPGFYFPDRNTEILTPARVYWRFEREKVMRHEYSARRWVAVGRLAPSASVEEARADLARIERRLTATYPTSLEDFPGFATTVLPILDSIAGQSVQSMLWVLLGAVSLVLLVACVNVANLLLARGAARQQEFAVRRALGAGRGRMARQLMVESVMLALVGGALGALIASWGTRALSLAAAAYVPRIDEVAMDWRVLTFALLASVVAGLAFGMAPALRLSATSAAAALKEGGRSTGHVQTRRSRDLLVVAECALAIVLLTGAGLLLRSLDRLQSVDPGFDPRNVLMLRLEFPSDAARAVSLSNQASIDRALSREMRAHEMVERVRSLPGVAGVGFTDDMFIAGQGNESITFPGRSADEFPAGELSEGLGSPEFFALLRVPLRRGRYLTRADAARRARVLWTPLPPGARTLADKERLATPEYVVVNEAFVRRFFPNEDPVGKKFCTDPTNKTYWYEIVGVVGDMHRKGLERGVIPEYFTTYIPSPMGRADLLVRTIGDPLALAASVRREVGNVFPGTMIVSVSTMDAQLGGFTALRRLQTWLLTTFALLALTLAAIGIFGLVHFTVAERTREIGVRVALGARPGDVMGMVLSQGMRMPAIGIVVGLVASLALTRVMATLLFEVGTTDPVTFAAVAFVLAVVAGVACWLAGRRAVRVDPVTALRQA